MKLVKIIEKLGTIKIVKAIYVLQKTFTFSKKNRQKKLYIKNFYFKKKSFKRDFINSFEAFLLTLMCILPYELYSNSLFQ